MTQIDDGGPAFAAGAANEMASWTQEGMSLRDYFAGQAIMGLCADPSNHDLFDGPDEAAENAFAIADAMISARKGSAA